MPDETIKPITYMKTHAADILTSVMNTRRPMVITHNGVGKMVIQDIDSYQSMRRTLTLLKIVALGKQAVERGDVKPVTTVFRSIERKRRPK